jgi:hypothetical protein
MLTSNASTASSPPVSFENAGSSTSSTTTTTTTATTTTTSSSSLSPSLAFSSSTIASNSDFLCASSPALPLEQSQLPKGYPPAPSYPDGHIVYDLFAVLMHSGTAMGGHYYAYIKSFTDQVYLSFTITIFIFVCLLLCLSVYLSVCHHMTVFYCYPTYACRVA